MDEQQKALLREFAVGLALGGVALGIWALTRKPAPTELVSPPHPPPSPATGLYYASDVTITIEPWSTGMVKQIASVDIGNNSAEPKSCTVIAGGPFSLSPKQGAIQTAIIGPGQIVTFSLYTAIVDSPGITWLKSEAGPISVFFGRRLLLTSLNIPETISVAQDIPVDTIMTLPSLPNHMINISLYLKKWMTWRFMSPALLDQYKAYYLSDEGIMSLDHEGDYSLAGALSTILQVHQRTGLIDYLPPGKYPVYSNVQWWTVTVDADGAHFSVPEGPSALWNQVEVAWVNLV